MLNQGTISITIYHIGLILLEPSLQTIALSYVLQELQGIEYMPCIFLYSRCNFIAQLLFRGITRTVY